MVLLSEIADVSAQVASVSGRRAKIDQMAGLLGRARADEVPTAVAFLSGELRQRQIGVGYAALSDLLAPRRETAEAGAVAAVAGAAADSPDPAATAAAAEPTLTLADADSAFAAIGEISGSGAQAQRRSLLAALFGRATEAERTFLIQLLAGDLRQGALEGVMVEAVAQAAAVPAGEVRRALMLGGSLPAVAQAALSGPAADSEAALTALRSFSLAVGRPLRPMLAASAATIADAMAKISPAAIEWKIDGIRVQVHKDGPRIAIFTRTLDDITARVPEIVEAVAALPASSAVLDGEVIALSPNGRPQPFQVTAGRAGSRAEVEARRGDVPLSVFFFDLLHLDGTDLIDLPARERYARLAGLLPAALLIPRTVTADAEAAEAFFADAVSRGHEGAVVKSLDAPYAAGRRGGEWIKVKPRHTLDLVVLAAEWGHGRRRGWLSNLHLGARDTEGDGFVMLGKTFKGLTDQMLAWQTGRLLELAADGPGQARMPQDARDAGGVVRVRPGLVVEIAFDGVQTSRRYPGGLALRFARVIRYRPDKQAADADTIDAVRAIAGKIVEE
ncbi:MAG TPA: ATP-dependent DNA ligase [Streptosporangiaceae bacterium]